MKKGRKQLAIVHKGNVLWKGDNPHVAEKWLVHYIKVQRLHSARIIGL